MLKVYDYNKTGEVNTYYISGSARTPAQNKEFATKLQSFLDGTFSIKLPSHFKPAIESALNKFRMDGFTYSEAKITELSADEIGFSVIASPAELFALAVKIGYALNEQKIQS